MPNAGGLLRHSGAGEKRPPPRLFPHRGTLVVLACEVGFYVRGGVVVCYGHVLVFIVIVFIVCWSWLFVAFSLAGFVVVLCHGCHRKHTKSVKLEHPCMAQKQVALHNVILHPFPPSPKLLWQMLGSLRTDLHEQEHKPYNR